MSSSLKFPVSEETIAARSTPPGAGAIAIVRVSGRGTLKIAGRLFRPVGGERISQISDRTLILGTLHSPPPGALDNTSPEGKSTNAPGPIIDQCLLVLWRAPHSYTGEDVAEFHLHGGGQVVDETLEAIYDCGARPAAPGEFTRRAFLNGRIDLAQAEAIADLIQAQTAQAARCALGQLTGGLSQRIEAIRARLVALTAEVEAYIDFPEEDLPIEDRGRMGAGFAEGLRELDVLLRDARRGKPLRDGARVVLAGRPNTGKSSLFNALLGRERAIVAPHPGTTRDTIEAEVDLEGIPTVLVDTAGLRERPEEIEALGIARTHEAIAASDLTIFLLDLSQPIQSGDREAFVRLREHPHLIVLNKSDLSPCFAFEDVKRSFTGPGGRGVILVSARTRQGIDELERATAQALRGDSSDDARPSVADSAVTPLAANQRHIRLLELARDRLQRACEGLTGRLPIELIAVDLRESLESLGAITGRCGLDEEILDSIFARFCIGK